MARRSGARPGRPAIAAMPLRGSWAPLADSRAAPLAVGLEARPACGCRPETEPSAPAGPVEPQVFFVFVKATGSAAGDISARAKVLWRGGCRAPACEAPLPRLSRLPPPPDLPAADGRSLGRYGPGGSRPRPRGRRCPGGLAGRCSVGAVWALARRQRLGRAVGDDGSHRARRQSSWSSPGVAFASGARAGGSPTRSRCDDPPTGHREAPRCRCQVAKTPRQAREGCHQDRDLWEREPRAR